MLASAIVAQDGARWKRMVKMDSRENHGSESSRKI